MKYEIKKKEDEIDLYYNLRKLFIELSNPKNKKEFNLINMYSNIFINIIFLKCRYQNKTEEFIKFFLSKYKNKILNLNNNIIINFT